MKKTVYLLAPLAVVALAACGPTREEQAAQAEAATEAEAEALPLDDMPPSITASHSYRCADNTILFVDFYDANKGALIRVGEQTATSVRVSPPKPAEGEAAPAAGAFASDDGQTTLEGSGAKITVKLPGKGAQACKS